MNGIAHAQRPGEFDKAVGTSARLDHVTEVGEREHDEAGAVREILMEGGERMLHRVLARKTSADHDVARKRVGNRHVFAGFIVRAVADGAGEAFGAMAHARERIHFGEVVGALRDVAFDSVEERVEALIGREHGRN